MQRPRDIVICDLDGTLALDDHRVHLIQHYEPKRWDEYFELCQLDTPNSSVVRLVRVLDRSNFVYILSGRSETVREKTAWWLKKHLVPYEHLQMRGEEDRTDDTHLKLRWIDELDIRERIWLVIEDRARVVKAWRAAGFTCLQCAPGEF